jgi:hypothetical protein
MLEEFSKSIIKLFLY